MRRASSVIYQWAMIAYGNKTVVRIIELRGQSKPVDGLCYVFQVKAPNKSKFADTGFHSSLGEACIEASKYSTELMRAMLL